MGKRNDTSKLEQLLEAMDESLFRDDGVQASFADNGLRVERILLDMLRPDPVQARRVLPEALHMKFHNNRLSPSQALRELVQIAQVAARQQGRPFSNVLELLADSESDAEFAENNSPEENTLRDLVNLAVTIRDDGLVNPLTVIDISQGVTRLYRIETGERRYWAHWLLRDFIEGYEGDSMVDCIIVPAEAASVFRQAKENTARKGLTAIAMARQAALLLLTVHGIEMPNHAVDNDFYRQALQLDLRSKHEYVEGVLSAMGGIKKAHFHRYKALLQLCDEAFELADRYQIDEFRLRSVLTLPPESQTEMIHHILKFKLSGRQVEEICSSLRGETDSNENSDISSLATVSPHIRKFIKTLKLFKADDVEDFVQMLLSEENSSQVAVARVESTLEFLLQVKERLSEK